MKPLTESEILADPELLREASVEAIDYFCAMALESSRPSWEESPFASMAWTAPKPERAIVRAIKALEAMDDS